MDRKLLSQVGGRVRVHSSVLRVHPLNFKVCAKVSDSYCERTAIIQRGFKIKVSPINDVFFLKLIVAFILKF